MVPQTGRLARTRGKNSSETSSLAAWHATTLGGDARRKLRVQYVLAAIGMAGMSVLLWKALRPQRSAARSVLAPDDDPEFLRGLSSRRQQPGEER
jgi:hypothetical protein